MATVGHKWRPETSEHTAPVASEGRWWPEPGHGSGRVLQSSEGKSSKALVVDWMCEGGRELIRMTHRSAVGQLGGCGPVLRDGTVEEVAALRGMR